MCTLTLCVNKGSWEKRSTFGVRPTQRSEPFSFVKAGVWLYELPGWPSADIHWDVESVSHIAGAVEAVGHRESGGCSGWDMSSSHPVPSNAFSLRQYTNTGWFYLKGNHCVMTESCGTLWVQLVLLLLTFDTLILSARGGGEVCSLNTQNHLLSGDFHALSKNLSICDFMSTQSSEKRHF